MQLRDRLAYAGGNFRRFGIGAATACLVLVASLNSMPKIEAAVFPVLARQEVEDISRTPEEFTFVIYVQKARDCPIAAVAWSVVDDDGRRRSIVVRGPEGDRATGTTQVPVGFFPLGPFTAEVTSEMNAFQRVEGILYYQCHRLWLNEQVLGPAMIRPLPPQRARWKQ